MWTLEIHSVNKKNLEIFAQLPKELLFLDAELRKKTLKFCARGHVVVRLTKQTHAGTGSVLGYDLVSLENLKKQWENAALHLGLNPHDITLSFLLARYSEVENFTENFQEAFVKEVVEPLCEKAFEDFEAMKQREGRELVKDIEYRISLIEKMLKKLEILCETLPEKYKKKLLERLETFDDIGEGLQERAAKELAFYAEKMDITEEVVRLKSHCKQLADLLKSDEKSIGKTLDFLLQEMFREVNTTLSKVIDIEAIQMALDMKSEFEKIREQTQNIE